MAGEEWFEEGEDIVTAAGVVYSIITGALWHSGLDLKLKELFEIPAKSV